MSEEVKKVEPVLPLVSYTDWSEMDLRIGTILSASAMPKANKLMILTVDLGESEPRQICAGIAEHYSPEEVINQEVLVMANLMPRELRGYTSSGMILMAEDVNGKPRFLKTSGETVVKFGTTVH